MYVYIYIYIHIIYTYTHTHVDVQREREGECVVHPACLGGLELGGRHRGGRGLPPDLVALSWAALPLLFGFLDAWLDRTWFNHARVRSRAQ